MKFNQLSGKAELEKPWINYLMPNKEIVWRTRGENRAERRAKEKEVRAELKLIERVLPRLKKGTKEWFTMDLRKSELELWMSSPHNSVNAPMKRGDK